MTEVQKFLDENPGIEYDPLVLSGRPPDLINKIQHPRKLSDGPRIKIKPKKEDKIPKEGKIDTVLKFRNFTLTR